MKSIMKIDYNFLLRTIKICGGIARNSYFSDNKIKFEIKKDASKVTEIDIEISNFFKTEFAKKYPKIPFFSEEESEGFKDIVDQKTFFIVDPIDGTSSFIKKKPEFTINLTLVANEKLLCSFIYLPIQDILYYANEGESYKIQLNKKIKLVNKNNNLLESYRVVATRRKNELKNIKSTLQSNNIDCTYTSLSSALKFGILAEGKFDIYMRRANIKLWDVISGFHIAHNANFFVRDDKGNDMLEYITTKYHLKHISRDDFRISEFIIQNSKELKVIF